MLIILHWHSNVADLKTTPGSYSHSLIESTTFSVPYYNSKKQEFFSVVALDSALNFTSYGIFRSFFLVIHLVLKFLELLSGWKGRNNGQPLPPWLDEKAISCRDIPKIILLFLM